MRPRARNGTAAPSPSFIPLASCPMLRLLQWADANRAVALDLVRIYLGLGLLARGLTFLADPAAYTGLLPGGAESPFATLALVHYVGLSHLAGGLFLTLGMLTRVAALIQVPILAGAAFLVHLPSVGLLSPAFAFSALVLALLVVLTIWGSGPWSLDRAVERRSARDEAEEEAHPQALARDVRSRPRLRPPAAERLPAPPRPEAAEPTDAPCACGHDRSHPHVAPERSYSGLSGLRFLTGTHARPTEVTFRCGDCGGVVEVLRDDPEALEAFRFERT